MIRSVRHMNEVTIEASDGRIGSVDGIYFDDERWVIRYLVADTGRRSAGPRVLISPLSIRRSCWDEQRLLLSISRHQVKNSPGVDHRPLSRQQEKQFFDYLGYPYYWRHEGLWGVHALPTLPSLAQIAAQRAAAEPDSVDPAAHLRSASEVERYIVRALDGNLGDVESLLFDDVSWAIRYLVVNTSNWCFGRHVAVAPEWITGICWRDRSLSMNVTRHRLKTAPPYDGAAQVDREWEADYYQHLQQPGYWLTETQARAITGAPPAYRQDDTRGHEASVKGPARPR